MTPGLERVSIVVSGMALLCGCGGRAEPATALTADDRAVVGVETATARISAIAETLELVGSFLPRRRTVLVSEVEGVIQKIAGSKREIQLQVNGKPVSVEMCLDIGQDVAKGDVLVELNPADFQLALASAEAKLARATRELEHLLAWERPEEVERLRALKREAEAHKDQCESELQRAESIKSHNPGAISAREYNKYLADAQKARALLAHKDAALKIALAGPIKEEVAVAKARVVEAQAEVAVRAEQLRKATIRAPYDAVITDRYADQGDRVTPLPRFELMEIVDLSVVLAQVGVPERYADRIQVADQVAVRVGAGGDQVAGSVVHVNDKVDPATRTFRVRVAVDNQARRFKVGQFVHAVFRVGAPTPVLVVPSVAVTYAGGQAEVFVVDQGRAAARKVTVGLANGSLMEIRTGLEPGQQVVVDDPALLADGMRVKLKRRPSVAQLPPRAP